MLSHNLFVDGTEIVGEENFLFVKDIDELDDADQFLAATCNSQLRNFGRNLLNNDRIFAECLEEKAVQEVFNRFMLSFDSLEIICLNVQQNF